MIEQLSESVHAETVSARDVWHPPPQVVVGSRKLMPLGVISIMSSATLC